jgi:DnaJ-class molecular chaperone
MTWDSVLGLRANTATENSVRRAYKQLALKWHPDRYAGRSQANRNRATATFRNVHAAYEEGKAYLADAAKRRNSTASSRPSRPAP